ncbi:MAG: hypothetical protein QUT27_06335, partial [candidate division Zixibacteria bacterium]|nr:hypothetical protein [candidate division Zixibacteria bacterium]
MAVPAGATRLNQDDGIWPNHSADWVRTLNRFASTETDAAFYNPAGLAFMKKKGLHVQFTNQTVYAWRGSSQDYWGIGNGEQWKLTNVMRNPLFNKSSGIPDQYTAETLSPSLPSGDIVWNGKNYAVYLSLAVTQAAPGLTFKQGLPVMDFAALAPLETASLTYATPTDVQAYFRKNYARRTEYYIAGTAGASYAFIDWMSAAFGVRYINASGKQELSVLNANSFYDSALVGNQGIHPWMVESSVKGHGVGFIFGLHFKPIDIIDIGLKYEYYMTMALKKKNKTMMAPETVMLSGQLNVFSDSWLENKMWYDAFPGILGIPYVEAIQKMTYDDIKSVGDTLKVTYPQTIALGFSVNIIKNLRAETSGEISLRPFADLGGRQKYFHLGYRVGQCVEWEFVPNYFVSAGYLYTDFGIKPNHRNEVDQMLTNHTVGGGFKLSPIEYLDIQVGAFYVFYKPETQKMTTSYTNVSGP